MPSTKNIRPKKDLLKSLRALYCYDRPKGKSSKMFRFKLVIMRNNIEQSFILCSDEEPNENGIIRTCADCGYNNVKVIML